MGSYPRNRGWIAHEVMIGHGLRLEAQLSLERQHICKLRRSGGEDEDRVANC